MTYYFSELICDYYNKGRRKINQDSIAIQAVNTKKGEALLAVVCDGLGGMDDGEIASGYLVEEISKWFYEDFILLFQENKKDKIIINSLTKLLFRLHNNLKDYGYQKDIHLGTTCSILLVRNNKGLVFNIGDSAVYILTDRVTRITALDKCEDNLKDNLIFKCIGIGSFKKANIYSFRIKKNLALLLSSDGYYHNFELDNAILDSLLPSHIHDKAIAQKRLNTIGKFNLSRNEGDNMSAIYIKY